MLGPSFGEGTHAAIWSGCRRRFMRAVSSSLGEILSSRVSHINFRTVVIMELYRYGPGFASKDRLNSGVREANMIATRFAMLICLAICRRVCIAVEQPISSALRRLPCFKLVAEILMLSYNDWHRTHLWLSCERRDMFDEQVRSLKLYLTKPSWMGLFEGQTPKPSYLMGVSLAA